MKYETAYKVTIDGEVIGYVRNKEKIENRINEYVNSKEGNIAFIEISSMPQYEYKFVNKLDETADIKVVDTIKESSVVTYKTYAITVAQEEKAKVSSEEEAEEIINEIKSNNETELDLNYGITTVYSKELDLDNKDEATEKIKSVVEQKIASYNAEQEAKRIEEERKKSEKALLAKSNSKSNTSSSVRTTSNTTLIATVAESPSGNIGSLSLSKPILGTITSRFGVSSSLRKSSHTGLDIAASSGTAIHPIASGTVTFAGWKGSYGNLVIINHGNGIESYYAHCSAIYTSVGANVTSSTTISAVGSTGNSTGPHLHLEIRQNGTPLNPQNYLYK